MIFAACARVQFSGGAPPWGRELTAILSFEAIVFWPVALYFYFIHPAWSWLYVVDPRRLPWGSAALALLGCAATLLGGYLAGWALLRVRRARLLYGAISVTGLLLAVMMVLLRSRLLSSGSFAEYQAGRALPAGETKLGWALAVCSLGMLGGIFLVALALRDQGKQFRAS